MILSVSRRTDIPAFYSDWFLNRLKEGYLYVRNPMNAHQISHIDLSPELVDCIVFWTKNPAGMLGRLEELEGYPYYFQFTLTGYGRDLEANLPDKQKVLIPCFQQLSRRVGKERVIWRYDPIALNERYTADYHERAFRSIADSLAGYTEKAVISFVDLYEKVRRNTREQNLRDIADGEMVELARHLVDIARQRGMAVESCAERIDLHSVGVEHGCCIDKGLIERLLGCPLKCGKDKNQRPECGCVESIDVGAYNTCRHGCLYCYANFNQTLVSQSAALYDPHSPLLCGAVGPEDKITRRAVKSLRVAPKEGDQMTLWDISSASDAAATGSGDLGKRK